MNPIPLDLPAGAVVEFNSLYPDRLPRLLVRDILLVSLPGGIQIDVGWHPQRDPTGAFHISVFRDDWENQLRQPIVTNDPQKVAALVQLLAVQRWVP